MLKTTFLLVFVCLIALFSVGCGGMGINGLGVTQSLYVGNYQGGYSRVDGTVSVSVPQTGNLSVSVQDGAEGTFTGTGPMNEDGSFSITATKGSLHVVVSGAFHGFSAASYCDGSISGQFTGSWVAAKQ